MKSHLLPTTSDGGLRPPPLDYRPPHAPYLPVAHIDADVMVVDKPSGLLSVPGKAAGLEDCAEGRAKTILPEALIVHRLDMDTSGLMILGRGAEAHRILSGQFAKRIVEKTYMAEVWGAPEAERGEIDLPLRADWPNRPRQMVCHEHGKPSRTLWEVAERRGPRTLLGLTPLTGRSHQLRVHLLEIGLPIMGDPFYAEGEARNAPRLMLHASRLRWRRPTGGDWAEVVSPPPF